MENPTLLTGHLVQIIVGIMIASCYVNRRRSYSVISSLKQGLLGYTDLEPRDEDNLLSDIYDERERPSLLSPPSTSTTHPWKKRTCPGIVLYTPNSSRYANYWHSRFIQKFPFLVEMFYWAINLAFYVSIKSLSELVFATEGVWKIAEDHGAGVLALEHDSPVSFLFPLQEVEVQHFFRNQHPTMLTILNRSYSLIHIPMTVR